MALVSSSDPDLRIYEPGFSSEYSSREEDAVYRSRLLAKIHNAYCKALERLTTNSKARARAAKRIVDGGFCFGLLDPASNIVANTLIPCERGEEGAVPEAKIEDLEHRSLEGMVTFLTRYFPYLADCEAVSFLLLADADLIVAFRMVVRDLGMKRFGSSPLAVNEALGMALRCAALAAKHPDTDQIVSDWLTISTCIDEAVCILNEVRRHSPPSSLDKLARLLNGLPPLDNDSCGDLMEPWRLAAYRPPGVGFYLDAPYQHTKAIKGTLQDAIHGFYLEALARLPAGDLRSRFHRSLLEAGHCYGPLDPVNNIIINTIWYEAVSPPTAKLEVDMISTMSLHRIENRSLYGLTSFVSTRHHHIDFRGAMELLLRTDAYLLPADCVARDIFCVRGFINKEMQGPVTSIEKAFLAAATASCHPKPEAQVELFTLCMSQMENLTSLLEGCVRLSSENVELLAKLLSPEAPSSKRQLRPFPYTEYLYPYEKIYKQVNAALEAYALMPGSGGESYELHIICGVNNNVSGPVGTAAKYDRSHMNFFATPRSGGTPVLFFAEVSNDHKGEAAKRPFCCIVSVPPPCAERVRCLYCDYIGIRIVHPVGENFHGCKLDFEKMVCGEDPCDEDFDPTFEEPYYTNMEIITHSRVTTDRVNGRVKDDRLYDDCFGPESDDYLSPMRDEDDSGMGSKSDEYHVPLKVWAQISCWEP